MIGRNQPMMNKFSLGNSIANLSLDNSPTLNGLAILSVPKKR